MANLAQHPASKQPPPEPPGGVSLRRRLFGSPAIAKRPPRTGRFDRFDRYLAAYEAAVERLSRLSLVELDAEADAAIAVRRDRTQGRAA